MNPEQYNQENPNENEKDGFLEKTLDSAKKAVALGAVITGGFSGDLQAQNSTFESTSPVSGSNITHVENASAQQEKDILSQESMSAFLGEVKQDGIEALTSDNAQECGSLVTKIDNYFEKIDIMTTGDVSPEQKAMVGKTLDELHQTLGIIGRKLSSEVEQMKEKKEELAASQATVHGGAYDLSEADLKEAGQMVMTQRENEIRGVESLSTRASELQSRIAAKFHALTGGDLK